MPVVVFLCHLSSCACGCVLVPFFSLVPMVVLLCHLSSCAYVLVPVFLILVHVVAFFIPVTWRSTVSSYKPPRKDPGGREREQPPSHPRPKPSPVQRAVGGVHPELDPKTTNGYAIADPQPFRVLVGEDVVFIIPVAVVIVVPIVAFRFSGGSSVCGLLLVCFLCVFFFSNLSQWVGLFFLCLWMLWACA